MQRHSSIFIFQPQAIIGGDGPYEEFVRSFLDKMFPLGDIPAWAVEALTSAGHTVRTTCESDVKVKGSKRKAGEEEVEVEVVEDKEKDKDKQ